MVTNKHHEVNGIADLETMNVGVVKDTKHKSDLEAVGVQNIQEVNDAFSLFKQLAQNKIDAILYDSIFLEYLSIAYANTNLDFKIIAYEPELDPGAQLVIVVAKDNTVLQQKINRGIKTLKESGELEKIKTKWLNFKS